MILKEYAIIYIFDIKAIRINKLICIYSTLCKQNNFNKLFAFNGVLLLFILKTTVSAPTNALNILTGS